MFKELTFKGSFYKERRNTATHRKAVRIII